MRIGLITIFLALATSCFVDGKNDLAQTDWETRAKQIFSDDKTAKDAYVLLSSSSYADNGQFLVVDDGQKARFYYAKPGESSFLPAKALSSENRQTLIEKATSSVGLASFEAKVFDGVQYEYIRLSKRGDVVVVDQRFAMNNPEAVKSSDATPYQELVASFRNLAN